LSATRGANEFQFEMMTTVMLYPDDYAKDWEYNRITIFPRNGGKIHG